MTYRPQRERFRAPGLAFKKSTFIGTDIDPRHKRKLRIRAAQNGHSMSQEVREILTAALDAADAEQEASA